MRKFIILLLFCLLPACGGAIPSEDLQPGIEKTDPTADPTKGPALGGAPGFDLSLALELGRLCLQSYQMLDDFNAGKTFTLPAPYTLVKQYFTNEDFSGVTATGDSVPIAFIATKDDNIYVVFRGTDTIVEWIDDSEIGQVPYTFVTDGGLTEAGFTNVYATINSDMIAEVKQLNQSGNYSNLFITGHSLGAGLAVLAVPDFAANTPFSDPIMYNFAGPRVGNPHFAEAVFNALDLTTIRVANTNDLVPKLPQPVVEIFKDNMFKTFFYDHVNTEHPITFGNPISGPTDVKDIEFNHIMCHYYNHLCAGTSDPASCMAMADGADGCNVPSKGS